MQTGGKSGVIIVLTSVAQLVRHRPTKQKVAGLIPSQGTCLSCEFIPGWGPM